MSKEMRQHIDNFRDFLTENSKKKLNISDVSDSDFSWNNILAHYKKERGMTLTVGNLINFLKVHYNAPTLKENSKKKLNISDVMFSESKISTSEEKELDDILFDINKCNGEEGMKKLVKMQSFWSGMNKSNKIRNKVLKAIKNRLEDIGF